MLQHNLAKKRRLAETKMQSANIRTIKVMLKNDVTENMSMQMNSETVNIKNKMQVFEDHMEDVKEAV